MIEYIHVQLSAWGRWSLRRASKGVGYSPVCPMFKDVRHGEGYESRPPSGVEVASFNELVDIEQAVSRLSQDGKRLCMEYYVVQGSGEEVASRLGIARRTLYDRLHMVQQHVMGHLNDIAAGA